MILKKNRKRRKKKIVAFLDRDGVINYDKGYISSFSNIKFRPGVIKGLQLLTKKKHLIYIITNQAGIAKGHFKLKELLLLNKKLISFLKNKKIKINGIKFCPHHPKALIKRYKINCKCRKPNNFLIKQVFKKIKIDTKNSFMIGDRKKDKIAAFKSGLRFQFAKNNFYYQIKDILNK